MKLITILFVVCSLAHAVVEPKTFESNKAIRVYKTGLKKKKLVGVRMESHPVTVVVPDKFDLRPELTPIRNQGSCGSCWSFSLTAQLEDGYKLHGKNPNALSQQYLVDCARNESGCNGGYFDAASYFKAPKGAPGIANYPYVARNGHCKSKPVEASDIGWHMLGTNGSSPTVADIEGYMVENHMPVSITVGADSSWMNYSSGVYNACHQTGTNHMINIVGWDNEGQALGANGNLPKGKGVWILRNSWGDSWGENGWMRSKMTDSRGRKCNNVAEEAAVLEF